MRHLFHWAFPIVCSLYMLAQPASAQQGLNNLWMGGFDDQSPPPWGGVDLDFISGSLDISVATRTIDFVRTNANITDVNGSLLFSTNGAYVANATGDTLMNGTGLNPSNYTALFRKAYPSCKPV